MLLSEIDLRNCAIGTPLVPRFGILVFIIRRDCRAKNSRNRMNGQASSVVWSWLMNGKSAVTFLHSTYATFERVFLC